MTFDWWEDAFTYAFGLAAGTRMKHKVTAVRDMRPVLDEVIGDVEYVDLTDDNLAAAEAPLLEYGVVGWRVDLADSETAGLPSAVEGEGYWSTYFSEPWEPTA